MRLYVSIERKMCWRIVVLLALAYAAQEAAGSQTKAPRITEHPTDVTVLRNDPATLRCGVSGTPTPDITWYRDGEQVEQRGHRLLLPDGSLFFLRVTQGRGRGYGDAGIYWCVARNVAGVARSKNATLTVAYLQPDFRLAPVSTKGIVGETVVLQCQAPRGVPEPEVTWRRNGQAIKVQRDDSIITQRLFLKDTGDLVIRNSEATDEGEYQCVAQNMAGIKESPMAKLTMHVRPRIIERAEDIVLAAGSDAVFQCSAVGDPQPQIIWRRLDAPLPAGRARPTENRTGLKIERVTLNDSGKYVCEAENDVGTDSSTATLTVLTPPEWIITPPAQLELQQGDNASLDCSARGIPSPLVVWRREGLFSSRDGPLDLAWETYANGTLRILNASLADSGSIYCTAVNEAGAILSRVSIQVTSKPGAFPPLFLIGPANQTLPVRSQALLQCQASDPALISWTKNGVAINETGGLSVVASGNLMIDQLDYGDAGDYSCILTVNNTNYAWTSRLSVESPVNPNIAFNRAPSDPLALPGPPSSIELMNTNKTDSSITLVWKSSSRMGASPLLGYTIEVFSPNCHHLLPLSAWSWAPETSSGWKSLARRYKNSTFTVNLELNCWLIAAVRAENSHGLSEPSLSNWFQKRAPSPAEIPADLAQIRDFLQSPLVELQTARGVNSSAVRLEWEILDGESYIEGLGLFYRCHSDCVAQFVTIEDPSASSHVLTALKANTNYTFFLIPFYGAVEGRPSNSKWASTLEDAPSGSPLNVTVRQFNKTSVLVGWLPPLAAQSNGVITGYQIMVRHGASGPLLANLTFPATPTSVAIGGLESGSIYSVQAAAWTQMGLGPASEPQTISIVQLPSPDTPPSLTSSNNHDDPHLAKTTTTVYLAQETMLVLLVGGSFILILIAVIIVLIIRRQSRKSMNNSGPNAAQLWIHDAASRASKEIDDTQLGTSEYAELFQQPAAHFEDPQAPAAYATTTIFRRTPHARPAIPNLTALLPPPPQYPPPPPMTIDNRRSTISTGSSLLPIAAGTLPCTSAGLEKRNFGLYRISNTQSQPAIDSFRGPPRRPPPSVGNRNSSFHLQESPSADYSDDDTYAKCLYEHVNTVPYRYHNYP